jgi:hypothetical protein
MTIVTMPRRKMYRIDAIDRSALTKKIASLNKAIRSKSVPPSAGYDAGIGAWFLRMNVPAC